MVSFNQEGMTKDVAGELFTWPRHHQRFFINLCIVLFSFGHRRRLQVSTSLLLQDDCSQPIAWCVSWYLCGSMRAVEGEDCKPGEFCLDLTKCFPPTSTSIWCLRALRVVGTVQRSDMRTFLVVWPCQGIGVTGPRWLEPPFGEWLKFSLDLL